LKIPLINYALLSLDVPWYLDLGMTKAFHQSAKIILQRIAGILLFGLGSGFHYEPNHLLFFGLSILTGAGSIIYLLIRNPRALSSREEKTLSSPRSDTVVLSLYYLLQFIGIFLVAGLEAKTSYRSSFLLIGIFPSLISACIATWALVSNPFLYPRITVHQEVEHQVISQGPYALVRHPTYAAAILNSLSFPLFFQTLFVLLTSIVICIILIIRTHLEDVYLSNHLEGYCEYQKKVRYRILMGVW
jgi:protein-S-isoprenylcysteine O-methyltransferase Ste14